MLWNTLHCLHKLIPLCFPSHRCFCTFDMKVVLPMLKQDPGLLGWELWKSGSRQNLIAALWGWWGVKTYELPPVLKQPQWPPPTRYCHSLLYWTPMTISFSGTEHCDFAFTGSTLMLGLGHSCLLSGMIVVLREHLSIFFL